VSHLFIAHDLALVMQVSDRVAVMHLGQLAKIGPADQLYRRPLHPYTGVLASVPDLNPATRRARRPTPLADEPRRRRSTRRVSVGSAPATRGPRIVAQWRSRPRVSDGPTAARQTPEVGGVTRP
jgi:ABC-type oligopeptide transport system ATPase subunit